MKATTEERKAWVAFMAAALGNEQTQITECAVFADAALEEYRKRFPAARPAYEDES